MAGRGLDTESKTNSSRLATRLLVRVATASICLAALSAIYHLTQSSVDITGWTASSKLLDRSYRESLMSDLPLQLHKRDVEQAAVGETPDANNKDDSGSIDIFLSPLEWYQLLEPTSKFHWTIIFTIWLLLNCLGIYHSVVVWRYVRRIKGLSWGARWRMRNAMSHDLRPYFIFLSSTSQMIATCACHIYSVATPWVWALTYIHTTQVRADNFFRPSLDSCAKILDKSDDRWEKYHDKCAEFVNETVPFWNDAIETLRSQILCQAVVFGVIISCFLIHFILRHPEIPLLLRASSPSDLESERSVQYTKLTDSADADEKVVESEHRLLEKA